MHSSLNPPLPSTVYASGDADLLRDFPMPSPARPSSVKKKLAADERRKSEEEESEGRKKSNKKAATASEAKKSEMSQWFSLFADLDPG